MSLFYNCFERQISSLHNQPLLFPKYRHTNRRKEFLSPIVESHGDRQVLAQCSESYVDLDVLFCNKSES